MSKITYRSRQLPRSGPGSLVISQLHTSLGRVATNCGLTRAGWVRWRRQSRLSPRAQQPVRGRDRGQVDPVVQHPGPDLRGWQVAEPWFVQHLQDLLAFGRAERVRRARSRPGRCARAGSAAPVVGRAWLAEQQARPLGVDQRRQLGDGRLDHLLDRGSESALSESCSKSACAFPTISNAVRVRASSASRRWLRRRTRSNSTCSGVRLRARPCPARPASAPASRARRHSTMWEVYKPSRRSNAPLSPGSVSRSYSARIASLYSGLNLRRRGRAGSWSAMSPSCDATTVVVMLTVNVLLSRPEREKGYGRCLTSG